MKRCATVLAAAVFIVALSLPLAEGATVDTVPGSPDLPETRQEKKADKEEVTEDTSPEWLTIKITCGDSPQVFSNTLFTTLRQIPLQKNIELLNDIVMLSFINHKHMYEGKQPPEIHIDKLVEVFLIDLHAVCLAEKDLSINDLILIKHWLIERFPHYYQEYVTKFKPAFKDTITRIVKEKRQIPFDDFIKKRQNDIKRMNKDLLS